jgi:hypothetical protein
VAVPCHTGPCGRLGAVRERWRASQNDTLGHPCSPASDKYRRRMRLEEAASRRPSSTPHARNGSANVPVDLPRQPHTRVTFEKS